VTTDFALRAASRDDAAELARLILFLGYPATAVDIAARWDAWGAEKNGMLVVEEGHRLLGMITYHHMIVFHRPQPVGRITSLVVDPVARGRGVGRALVDAAQAILRAAGCGLVEVTSNVRRADAHRFYEHLGYERTSFRFARSLALDAPE
jgi:ribosomal protein S18 acetylase RimI-like enzyme